MIHSSNLFGKLAITLCIGFLASVSQADVWEIDGSHSNMGFTIKHMMVSKVKGTFKDFKGTFNLDEKDMSKTTAEATIETTSINTDNADRDKHLRSADFFDVTKFPKMTFKSKKWEGEGKDAKLVGDLTLHGKTKEVTLNVTELTAPVKDPFGGTRRGLSANTKINRKDFGLTWNKAMDAGGVVLGEDVDVTVELELMKPKAPVKKSAKS
jgi:polyisoprenoid-binding protein YceI